MNLVKVLRLRESQVDIDGRLSYMVSQTSNYKGAISDVRLEVYQSTAVGPTLPDGSGGVAYDEFELKFIELFKLGIAGQPPEPDVVKKYENIQNQYGDTTQKAQDYVIKDFIERNAFRHLQRMYTGYSIGVIQSMSKDFYTIVQDPWQDEPPLTRIYGYDPYFLNNGVEVRVRWYGGTQSVTFNSPEYVAGLTGGFVYSNNDGTETYNKLILSPGNTPSNPFVQNTQDIEFAKSEKKKISKSIIAVVNNTQPNFYTIADSNQIVLAGTGSYDTSVIPKNFTGDTIDDVIIKNFIDLWKTKVPNYDLKLCTPSYYPNLIDLEVIPPFSSQNAGTPSNDGQPVVDNTPEAVKFNLSIVYDTFRKIKAGEDLPDIKIYVGDPPKEGEFLFDEDEFDDSALLDEEYLEAAFQGDGENILSLQDERDIQEELDEQRKNGEIPPDLPPGDTTNLPAKSPGGEDGKYSLQFNGVPYYAQWDARWGKDGYSIKNKDGSQKQKCTEKSGKESNLQSSGCGVTSVTMVINYWATRGKTRGKFTTPKEMGDIFSKNGGRVCNSGSAMSEGVKKYIESTFGLSWIFLSSESKVIEALKKKYPVVICGGKYKGLNHKGESTTLTTAGHYIVLTGIDSSGTVRANDPGYRLTKAVAAFPNGDIVGDSNTPRYNVLIYPVADGAPKI